jgi:hypothetical protein
MTEQLAIIREVGYGCRDLGKPVLWFSTYIDEGLCALQVLSGDEADVVITESGVYDVHSLDGWPCAVELKGGLIMFKRILRGSIAKRGSR